MKKMNSQGDYTPTTPEEIACVDAVNAAPKSQRQSAFNKACQFVNDKTRIAVLALALGVSTPAAINTTQAAEPQRIEQVAQRAPLPASVIQSAPYQALAEELRTDKDFTSLTPSDRDTLMYLYGLGYQDLKDPTDQDVLEDLYYTITGLASDMLKHTQLLYNLEEISPSSLQPNTQFFYIAKKELASYETTGQDRKDAQEQRIAENNARAAENNARAAENNARAAENNARAARNFALAEKVDQLTAQITGNQEE